MMFSRVALFGVRQRPFHTSSRLAFAQSQSLSVGKKDLGQTKFTKPPSGNPTTSKYSSPLRHVKRDTPPTPAAAAADLPGSSRTSEPVTNSSEDGISSQKYDDGINTQPLPDLRQGIPSEYESDTRPQTALPDLTQGIPSTIDAELSRAQRVKGASEDSFNITEGATDPQSPDATDRGGDGLPRSSYISSSDRRRAWWFSRLPYLAGAGILAYGFYTGRNWTEEEAIEHKDVANGYTPGLMYARAKARWGSTVSYYQEPVMKKLLPDASAVDPNMPPYTLVVGLEDVLVHSEWSREHGWRIAKRPGLDYFLRYLHSYYELVLFSNSNEYTVAGLRKKIDPYQMCHFLTREMTSWEDGIYVKDLSYLNRDLKKVVVVDCDSKALKNQRENAIIIPPWTGDPRDTTLIDYIPFLEYIAAMGYEDQRDVLKSFEGKDIPVEFARRQKLLREKFESDQAKKRRGRSGGAGFSLGSLFGTQQQKAQPGMQSIQAAEAEGKMYPDIIRERGQEAYKMLEAHLAAEGPKMLAESEAFEKKMNEEAQASMKSGIFGWMGGSKKE